LRAFDHDKRGCRNILSKHLQLVSYIEFPNIRINNATVKSGGNDLRLLCVSADLPAVASTYRANAVQFLKTLSTPVFCR
jgi:hypothetical protein